MGFTFTRNLTAAGGLVCVSTVWWLDTLILPFGDAPVSTFARQDSCALDGRCSLFSQARRTPSASWNCADCRCGTWAGLLPPILGAAFSLRIHRKWMLQHYSLVRARLTGYSLRAFGLCIGRRIALERGTANMPRFFPGQLSNSPVQTPCPSLAPTD